MRGDIELQHVSFKYPTRPDVQIFRDLCLRIPSRKVHHDPSLEVRSSSELKTLITSSVTNLTIKLLNLLLATFSWCSRFKINSFHRLSRSLERVEVENRQPSLCWKDSTTQILAKSCWMESKSRSLKSVGLDSRWAW